MPATVGRFFSSSLPLPSTASMTSASLPGLAVTTALSSFPSSASLVLASP